jgi:hypothetical protein
MTEPPEQRHQIKDTLGTLNANSPKYVDIIKHSQKIDNPRG